VSAPVDCEPLSALAPDHAPEPVQEVALLDDQVNVEATPLLTVLGAAAKLTVGAAAFTETVADCDALPPVPVHVSTYVEVAFNAPVDCEPLVATAPDHAPEAVHAVALLVAHDNVELAPLATELGAALRLTVGTCFALTVTVADCTAVPPLPVQESE
jgi:hypothetical protein